MWVLVVVFFAGESQYAHVVKPLFRDLSTCEVQASNLYYHHMATRPDPSYYVVSYCSEVPKGV